MKCCATPEDRSRSERGAILVQAAVSMFVLIGFSAFVVDYGVLWLSREQAQNAADAGAMAGAMSLAHDDAGIVEPSAIQVASANPVWFESPSPVVSLVCPPAVTPDRCVRVDVHRDGTFGSSAVPTIFASVFGLASQPIRATASAHVAVGNSTNCLKPWAIPDKWDELRPAPGPWDASSVYEAYAESGPGAGSLLVPSDNYIPPGPGDLGTGLRFDLELGLPMTLSFADPETSPPISPGFLLPLQLAGANTYEQNIAGCNGRLSSIGQSFSTGTASLFSPTDDGFSDLIAADAGATWDAATNTVQGSCAPVCASISPRLVALAVFDVERYQFMRSNNDWTACPGGTRCVQIVNIIGFFLDSVAGPAEVSGYLARYPGLVSPDSPSLLELSSFAPAITLVR